MNNKTLSLKDKKIISEKLRNENKKMEIRLQQLKLTMSKEKEDRLLNGNSCSMWSNGAPGSLGNYKATIATATVDRSKKVKLKMLKEEEEMIIIQSSPKKENLKQIFNGDNWDQDSLYSRDDSYGGRRKCGQCEDNLAAVNCKECTEMYCARCFASFHLKGALRKHRSTPISNISNRVSIPSPLFKAPDYISANNSYRDKKLPKHTTSTKNNISEDTSRQLSSQRRDSKENLSPVSDPLSLADCAYNEDTSTKYFQDALLAWRNGEDTPVKPVTGQKRSISEHSTETSPMKTNMKLLSDVIQFTPSLSYAEQLLLRKHRSCQLEPVEMKFILNRMAKNNKSELLENQRLLESNLMYETSAINASADNRLLADSLHVDIESLSNLWSEAAYLSGREPSGNDLLFLDSHFEIKEVISSSEDNCIKPPEIRNENAENDVSDKNDNNDTKPRSISENNNNNNNNKGSRVNTLLEKPTIDLSTLKVTSKRPHSAVTKNSYNDRPQSARRMSARTEKGGLLTTKPSTLLNMLASFSDYLPNNTTELSARNVHSAINIGARSNSAVTTKLNYNFYKTSPQSWKPSQAWPERQDEIYLEEKERNVVIEPPIEETFDEEYEEELQKLNFVANNSNYQDLSRSVILDRLSGSSSEISVDGDLPKDNNVNLCCENDDREEEEEAESQLMFLERELTLISRKTNKINDDEIIMDSLDLENCQDSLELLESDKFNFEDSLDFQQRFSRNSQEYDEEGEEDEVLGNCSSRFDDYDDVHNLH